MATIEKRTMKDGSVRWWLRVFVGRDENGRQRFVIKRFDRKKDPEKEARRLERQRDHGMLREPSKISLSEYMKHWLKVKAGEIRARTRYDYKGVVKRYVQEPPDGAPAIGLVRLDRLTPESFEELYAWLREHRGLGPRTIPIPSRRAAPGAQGRGPKGHNCAQPDGLREVSEAGSR